MKPQPPFDPSTLPNLNTSTPTTGQGVVFNSGLTTGCGTIYFINKSAVGMWCVFDDGETAEIPAWWARPFAPKKKVNQLWLSQAYTLVNASMATGIPISSCTIEVYQQTEDASGLYSGPINYQTSVGNPVATVGLSNFFDVTNPAYGGNGNGVFDNTAAFLSAISAAQSAGGGIVYVPTGIYVGHLFPNPNVPSLQAMIHLPSNVTLMGDGPGASIIKLANGAAVDQQSIVLNWFPSNVGGTDMNIGMKDICIDGNAAGNPTGASLSGCWGVIFWNVRNLHLDNVTSKNNVGSTTGGANGPSGKNGTSFAFQINQAADVYVSQCNAYSDDGGVSSSGFDTFADFNMHLLDCTARDLSLGIGFQLQQTTGLEMVNCLAYNLPGDGHAFFSCSQSHMVNCQGGIITPPTAGYTGIPANTPYGVSRGFVVRGVTDSDFTGCFSYDATTNGFVIEADGATQSARVRFANCEAKSSGNGDGFQVISASQDISFVNCDSVGNTQNGFRITSTDTAGIFLLDNCRAINNTQAGFRDDTVGSQYRLINCEAEGNTNALHNPSGTNYASITGVLTAPAVPLSTTALTNPFPFAMHVTVAGGTVSQIAVNGTNLNVTSGTVKVPANGTITLTYTVAPTWVWIAD